MSWLPTFSTLYHHLQLVNPWPWQYWANNSANLCSSSAVHVPQCCSGSEVEMKWSEYPDTLLPGYTLISSNIPMPSPEKQQSCSKNTVAGTWTKVLFCEWVISSWIPDEFKLCSRFGCGMVIVGWSGAVGMHGDEEANKFESALRDSAGWWRWMSLGGESKESLDSMSSDNQYCSWIARPVQWVLGISVVPSCKTGVMKGVLRGFCQRKINNKRLTTNGTVKRSIDSQPMPVLRRFCWGFAASNAPSLLLSSAPSHWTIVSVMWVLERLWIRIERMSGQHTSFLPRFASSRVTEFIVHVAKECRVECIQHCNPERRQGYLR